MSEIFDIVDDNGNPTGKTATRKEAHSKGLQHRTAHVWIFRKKDDKLQVLLQKRCKDKDSFPGCFDISSAGHIPAGVDFIPSAIRELKEELGIDVDSNELNYCGLRKIILDEVFHGEEFHDRQISKVYYMWLDKDEDFFKVQKEEIDLVMWINFHECYSAVKNNSIPNCIDIEELDMLFRNLICR